MSQPFFETELPLPATPNDLVQALSSSFAVSADDAVLERLVFLDTFDWRLYREGLALTRSGSGARSKLSLRNLSDRAPLLEAGAPQPRFVRDLPEGALKDRLFPLVEARALEPLLYLCCRRHRLSILDKRQKTVCRVVIESPSASAKPRGRKQVLPCRIGVLPVKGYRRHGEQVITLLKKTFACRPAGSSLADAALLAVGHIPLTTERKMRFTLSPAMPAIEAAREVLSHLLETIQINCAGAIADRDIEFLHDLRVAVRRTRSFLSQGRAIFPDSVVRRYIREFRWLGSATTMTRDLDVYLLNFPCYLSLLPDKDAAHLSLLETHLRKKQRQAQKRTARALQSKRFSRLTDSWGRWLDQEQKRLPPAAEEPIGQVARKRIWKAYRRVIRDGSAIGPESPAGDLHDLRKQCKKLRYLMEFFRSLYPRKQIQKAIRWLRSLQDNLGLIQDLHVQIDQLRMFTREMAQDRPIPAEALAAIEALVEQLQHQMIKATGDFASVFSKFVSPERSRLFASLFRKKA